jgi:hypothetical protein
MCGLTLVPSDKDVVAAWKTRICDRAAEVDPNEEFTWEGIWVGFVIGIGRPDLATYEAYMDHGFPPQVQR